MNIIYRHHTLRPLLRRVAGRLAIGSAVVAMAAAGAACDGASAPPAGQPALTVGQLSTALAGGPLRVEVTLRSDGTVRELEIEDEGPGHESELEGRVLSVDVAAQRLEIEHLGTIDATGATRFRDTSESNAEEAAFWDSLAAAVESGAAVWVDARGAFGPDAFLANELRWEDDAKTQLEVDVDATALDLSAGVLRVGWLEFALADARIQYDDGDDRGDDDLEGDDDDSDDDGDDSDDNDSDDDDDDDSDDDDDDDSDDDDGDETEEADAADDA